MLPRLAVGTEGTTLQFLKKIRALERLRLGGVGDTDPRVPFLSEEEAPASCLPSSHPGQPTPSEPKRPHCPLRACLHPRARAVRTPQAPCSPRVSQNLHRPRGLNGSHLPSQDVVLTKPHALTQAALWVTPGSACPSTAC